jgi:flagellar biosynthesis protein FlhB
MKNKDKYFYYFIELFFALVFIVLGYILSKIINRLVCDYRVIMWEWLPFGWEKFNCGWHNFIERIFSPLGLSAFFLLMIELSILYIIIRNFPRYKRKSK